MIKPSGAFVISAFELKKKSPPWMNTSTGSFDAGTVSLGRTMFRFKQSSEVTDMVDNPNGANDSLTGCGHAGP